LFGAAYSAVQTPTGRLLRRSAASEDRPAVFAAQFALSHATWLLTYPLAGSLGSAIGQAPTAAVLALITLAGVAAAWLLWPARDPEVIEHEHRDLSRAHPHMEGAASGRHAHAFVIDDHHRRWPQEP